MASHSSPTAIVTDASERVALHVIRALGRAGVRVHAVEIEGRSPRSISFLSRYTARSTLLPSWENSSQAWAEALLSAGSPGDVLMPTCFNTIVRMLKHRQALSQKYRFLLPPEERLRRANDKWEVHKLAASLDIPVPKTFCPADAGEAREAAENLGYPAVVKLRHDENVYLPPGQRWQKVSSPQQAIVAWQRMAQIQPRPLLQEFIPGECYGIEGLYSPEGYLVAIFAHRRLVELPFQGGSSAVCESVHPPQLIGAFQRLLDALDWRGVAMAEFKKDARTGTFYLLEINPRFWGSITLSEIAGVNFPYLLYCALTDRPVEARPEYRSGVKMRLLPMYLMSILQEARAYPLSPLRWLSKLRYLFDPRVKEGLFCLDDLKPALAYSFQHLRRL